MVPTFWTRYVRLNRMNIGALIKLVKLDLLWTGTKCYTKKLEQHTDKPVNCTDNLVQYSNKALQNNEKL